ncbi:MAG: Wzz/FepE/Etk N-terminal domain-containing protein [Anaerococcus sp.]|nr:Wzz/FepE/Etk N-terminal domain-containing protein [Peptoniphilaceae bacterium]MDY3056085.1 Wzz/FepE/Etk N-terminal domain-containing protein [Anaerococcus sp.]
MEKITTYELFKALKRKLALILSVTILLGVLGGVYGKFIKDQEYTARTVMIIVGNDDEEISYNKLLLNEKLSNIYSQILTSEDIYRDAIEDLGLKDISPRELKASLTTEVNSQAGIISFELISDNEDKAADSLKTICEKFKLYVKDYLKTDNLDYLQEVSVKNDSKQDTIKYGLVGLILGFFLSLLFVCLKEVVSQKIKDEQYIRDLGIDVLGVIDEE